MTSNILITGAAGYIGGSIVATLAAGEGNRLFEKSQITAAVRSKAQADSFASLGVNVLQLDLANQEEVTKSILHHKINIIIHCASSINPTLSLNLVNALKKQKEASGTEVYLIHTSAMSAFVPNAGWPSEEFKDSGPVFEVEKQLADSYPVRKTDVEVIEHAKAEGVTSYTVVPCLVYGEGSGPWNRLSVVIPPYVKASTTLQKVYKFPENITVPGVHITDMTNLYILLLQKILLKADVPHGTKGYYFALSHDLNWWEILKHMAVALKARGLVHDATMDTWESDKVAAEHLGVPEEFIVALWKSGGNLTSENSYNLGWKPTWDEARFYENINDEIDAVVEHGKAKSSLIDSLFEFVKKG